MRAPTISISIASRFNGPPRSGNGGYVAGMLARHLDGAVDVRLFAPPPLEQRLEIERVGDSVRMLDGERIIAEARPGGPSIEAPAAPSFVAAEEASRNYLGFTRHPLPHCFVCGPTRSAGDGLRVFAGPLPGTDLVAAPWIPDATLADAGDGSVGAEFLWAVLDCPGVFAFGPENDRFMVLGTLSALTRGRVAVGEHCVVAGWPLGRDGRKHYSGTALFGEDGALRGLARATWIEIEATAF